MANIPITQLPNADPLTGTELVPIVQNGVTVRTTTQAISQSPSLNQTFLTVGLESTLPNSRYFSTDNSLTITDNGPQSFFRIGLTGAVADFNSIGNGFVVKTSPTSLLNRSIAVANAGLSITDGSGLSGNPTLSLSGLPLSLAQASGSGLLSLDSGSMLSPVAITGTAGQISVANGTGVGGNPTLSLDATGVVSGSYTLANITVDGYGRITSASNGTVVGTVTSVSVVNANGFSGNVADATGNASITIETTVTGILKGNGTAISAATSGVDYAPATSGTSILYGDGSGGFSNVTIGTGLTFAGGTLSATSSGTVTSVTASAPLASSGGSTPDISITQAGSSTDGYLSSTDWNTFNNKGSGTVTSVGLTAGTGISVSGSPITGSGSITVTNTAPDQIVTLTAGSNVTITGTYPSFTIAATGGGGGSGTVTSVGLALPSEFTITNSPVTTSGTLTGAWASQTQNYVLASPNGSSGTPSFRALVSADIPALNYAPPTSGTDILYGNGTGGFSNATVGTGLSFTGGTLSNSAPDQVVSLTASTGISVSGTYPSFTVTNSAPDQIVSLTGAGTTSITGTYPNFTITSNDQFTGTVTSVAALTIGTTGTDLSSTVANPTTTPVITLNVPTASAVNRGVLSSTDWSTFNGKQTAYTNLTSIGSLANSVGWLYNNGSGTFSYSTPTKTDVGLGNVTNDAQTRAAIVPNTTPTAGQILVGNAGGTAYAPVSMSSDATLASTGALTLATVNSNVGSFTFASITVNAKGLITAASSGSTPVTSFSAGTTGFSPSTATTGAITLSGTLNVANGGTGTTSLTANNVILGNGTSAVQFVAPGANGNVLTSDGTTWTSAPASGGVTSFSAGTTGFTPNTATTGAVTLAGTLALTNGGTGATSAPAANANIMGFTTTATAAGTTTLTNTSSVYQLFTGTSTQTVQLPVTSTLSQGWYFHIVNNSTGNVTVNSSGGNLVITVLPGTTAMVTCILTSGTTAASWEAGYTDFSTATGTGSVVLGTSPTMSGPTFNDGYTEEVYPVVDAAGVALSPTNGSIQTWTLGASRTPTQGTWAEGQSITLMIDDGTAFTVTWTSIPVTWVNGIAPTLATTGFTVIELWKVGTTIYGSLVGNV